MIRLCLKGEFPDHKLAKGQNKRERVVLPQNHVERPPSASRALSSRFFYPSKKEEIRPGALLN